MDQIVITEKFIVLVSDRSCVKLEDVYRSVRHVLKFNISFIKATFIIAFLWNFLVGTEIKVSSAFCIFIKQNILPDLYRKIF